MESPLEVDNQIIQFARNFKHKDLNKFSDLKINKVTFNYEGNINSNIDFLNECADQMAKHQTNRKQQKTEDKKNLKMKSL